MISFFSLDVKEGMEKKNILNLSFMFFIFYSKIEVDCGKWRYYGTNEISKRLGKHYLKKGKT
jgi:hypothetical protein